MSSTENESAERDSIEHLISTFSCGDTMFGFRTNLVEEVVKPGNITPVHNSPSYIVGVTNLRGRIITVVDLSRKLGIGTHTLNTDSCMYILHQNRELVGVLVDAIKDIEDVANEEILPAPENFTLTKSSYVNGVFQRDTNLIVILDSKEILSVDEHEMAHTWQ